jgi:nucleotide-binding universal stress UspA family protein
MDQVLIGVDGSKESANAARVGAELARVFGISVTLVHVVPPSGLAIPAQPFVQAHLGREPNRIARQRLEEIHRLVSTSGQHVETQVTFGDASEVLLEIARRDDVRMVVVGGRALSGWERALHGSVADSVRRGCGKPVIVTH